MNKEDIKIIQDKIKIFNEKTVKQVLENKKLFSEIKKREVISEKELIEMYSVPLGHLKGLKRKGIISYFNTKGQLNISQKGTKYYYFLDEVQNLLSYNINYNQSFVFRYNLMNKVILTLSKELISEKQVNILTMLFKDNKSIDEIAEELSIGYTRTSDLVNKASNTLIYRINQLDKLHKHYKHAAELEEKNKLLMTFNKSLHDKFKRGGLSVIDDSIVGHFIKHKLNLLDLKKTLLNDFSNKLSVRAINCLEQIYVCTLEELLEYKKSDLMLIRNMGKQTLNEICQWLEDNYFWKLS